MNKVMKGCFGLLLLVLLGSYVGASQAQAQAADAPPTCTDHPVGVNQSLLPSCAAEAERQKYDSMKQAINLAYGVLYQARDDAWAKSHADQVNEALNTLASTADQLDRDFGKMDGSQLPPFLSRTQDQYAEHHWPVPKTVGDGARWMLAQWGRPVTAPAQREAMMVFAGEQLSDLNNIREQSAELTAQAIAANRAPVTESPAEKAGDARLDAAVGRFGHAFFGKAVFGFILLGLVIVASGIWKHGDRKRAVRFGLSGAAAAAAAGGLGDLGLPWWVTWALLLLLGGAALYRYLPWDKFLPKVGLRDQHESGSGVHGTASFAKAKDAIAAGRVLPKSAEVPGFALGRQPDLPATYDNRVRYMGHVITCAPNRTGKGVSAVIPTLLEYPGSAIVLDVKGENFAATARARREMGQKVHLVDPFGVVAEFQKRGLCEGWAPSSFNWLDALDLQSPDVVGQSAELADMLVIPGKDTENGAHFDETAKDLLRGLIVHVAGLDDPARRTMGEVRRLLALPFTAGEESDEDEGGDTATETETLWSVLVEMAAAPDVAYGVAARAANAFVDTQDKERSSILSTARRHTAFLDDPRIAASLGQSDFSLADLKREPATVYLVMPPGRMAANARYMRGIIGLALSAMLTGEQKPPHDVLFMLDEFAQLGRMKQIEDSMSVVRGYGVAYWPIIQSLDQIKAIYPKWQGFFANATKQFFGIADFDTAKYVSDSLGTETVAFRTEGTSSSSGFKSSSSGTSTNEQLSARALMTPDEVMTMPKDVAIVLVNGEKPYVLAKLNYLRDAEYAGRFDPNPFHV